MIRISRSSQYANSIRAYKVLLDGAVLGDIKNGATQEFETSAGKHTLKLRVDWCSSNEIEFESDGSTAEFECGCNMRGWTLAFSLLYVTLGRSRYLWLRPKTPATR